MGRGGWGGGRGEGDRRGGLEKAGWLVAELAGVTQGRLRDQRSLLFSSIFLVAKKKRKLCGIDEFANRVSPGCCDPLLFCQKGGIG